MRNNSSKPLVNFLQPLRQTSSKTGRLPGSSTTRWLIRSNRNEFCRYWHATYDAIRSNQTPHTSHPHISSFGQKITSHVPTNVNYRTTIEAFTSNPQNSPFSSFSSQIPTKMAKNSTDTANDVHLSHRIRALAGHKFMKMHKISFYNRRTRQCIISWQGNVNSNNYTIISNETDCRGWAHQKRARPQRRSVCVRRTCKKSTIHWLA